MDRSGRNAADHAPRQVASAITQHSTISNAKGRQGAAKLLFTARPTPKPNAGETSEAAGFVPMTLSHLDPRHAAGGDRALSLVRRMLVRSLGPNLQAMFAAIVMIVTIGALVFWIMGAAPPIG